MPAVLVLWLALAGFQNPPQAVQPSKPSEHFVQSHGIRLHYLDWGGSGEPLLLLTGFGTPADTFQPLAVGLREQFHVYALTRRGLPPSDEPQSGYELSTLVADIVAFLDARRLDQVHLVGHSLAGLEMTELATRYPKRVRSVVYLDAIADPASANRVLQDDPLKTAPASGSVWGQISRWWSQYSVDFSGVESPALAMVALQHQNPGVPPSASVELRARAETFWRTAVVPLQNRWIEEFRRQVPQARVVILQNAEHYFYIERAPEVLRELRLFYAGLR